MTSGDTKQLRVVVTGAAGRIGTVVRERLGARWQLIATDIAPRPGVQPLDVTAAAACEHAFAGADAVVHLAANPDPEAEWRHLQEPNIEGAFVVAEAVRRCQVPRLVLASSLHAVSAYDGDRQRRSDDPPLPANIYGATKAWAEALGSWVAATSSTSVVALRIGFFSETPPSGRDLTPRNLSAWLSHHDCAELIRAAVETDVNDFTIVSGISANRHRIAELGANESRIGYRPVDDAWRHLDDG